MLSSKDIANIAIKGIKKRINNRSNFIYYSPPAAEC